MSNCGIGLAELEAHLSRWPDDVLQRLMSDWQVWAREEQLAPENRADGPWRTWLFLGGRGAGKTRAGAEWVRARALSAGMPDAGPQRIALVGETICDVQGVMVEGCSGLLAIHGAHDQPRYERSRNRLVWPNGSVAQFYSAERPDGLRGPQFHAAWCDELVKWRHAERTWDMLQFGLRLGAAPQAVVTSTPRPLPLLKRLIDDPGTEITRASTRSNQVYLSDMFIAEIERRYAGTVLGRQELDGEIIEDVTGALWRSDWIDEARVTSISGQRRTVVAVDPPVTAHARSDACGIVVAALGAERRGFVLADRTLQGRSPDVWARAVAAAFADFEADCVVVEVNQGGDLVEQVLRQVASDLPIRKVRATRGKWVRAEPIAALYAEGRVSHVGRLDDLEKQMLRFGADGSRADGSPDRVDALVWALTELMLAPPAQPSVRRI